MTDTERAILASLRSMDDTDLRFLSEGKLQMVELSALVLRMKLEDTMAPTCCSYHRTGGPLKLRCGNDQYGG